MIWFLSREGEYIYELYCKGKALQHEDFKVLWISRELGLKQLIYEAAKSRLNRNLLKPLLARDVLQVCCKLGFNGLGVTSRDLSWGEYLEISGIKPIEVFEQLEFSDLSVYEKYSEYLVESMQGARKIQLYDVGWSCTMQYCLQCLLRLYVSESVEIDGIYLGNFKPRFPISARGIICNDARPVDAFRAIKHCVEIVEILHCSRYGRVIGVDQVSGVWAPVREGFHELGEHLDEVLQYRRVWDSVFEAIYFSDEKDQAIRNLFRLLKSPTDEELEFFGELKYLSKIGEVEGRAIAKPVKGVFYLLRPDKLLRDYKTAFWRLGFYRRLPRIYRFILSFLMLDLRFGR